MNAAVRTLACLVVALFLNGIVPSQLAAQQGAAGAGSEPAHENPNWWKNAVIYEIYPRSFQDSNGDGIGDLNGITSRLDYLQKMGVSAIWLTPIYPSPQVDFGYDISNYEAIDPQYGTMADFDRLEHEADKRHIGIIMDLVLNHTSDQDPWFIESAKSRTNPKADWYMWHDAKMVNGKREPPNNWLSVFGGSAWQWDPARQQYYYHRFYVQQPDLNWSNPQVRKAMFDVVRFWINRGVAGFRLDAITSLFEDPQFRNEEYILGPDGKPEINAFGDKEVKTNLTDDLPEVHDVIRQLRQVTNETKGRKVILIGETYLRSVHDLDKWYGTHNDELDLPMDMQVGFPPTAHPTLDVARFRARINEAETEIGGKMPLFVFDNHDNPRWDRYITDDHKDGVGRVLATMLFASRDTAMMYYGDAIGMVTTPPKTKAEVKDPIGIRGWPKEKGRDGERTPMQWDAGKDAGFSTAAKTWLPIPPSYKEVNVAAEEKEPDSLLHWYRQIIALKANDAALHDGEEVMLNPNDPHVLSWMRKAPDGEVVVVACNFTAQPETINLDLAAQGVQGTHAKTLLKSPDVADPQSLQSVALGPYSVYIGRVR
ncbi:MAG TPA: alpha-glucosidase [Acidobacteriaceae bacterium]|jgi:alpha-glucosidase|nr:alpha-glucosidase [Acidobacteriaceae bacterium]